MLLMSRVSRQLIDHGKVHSFINILYSLIPRSMNYPYLHASHRSNVAVGNVNIPWIGGPDFLQATIINVPSIFVLQSKKAFLVRRSPIALHTEYTYESIAAN